MNVASQTACFFLCLLVVTSARCPHAEDLYPCDCEDDSNGVILRCDGEDITPSDVERALDQMRGIEITAVELYDIDDFGTMKGDMFAGHNIRKLLFDHCDIEALTDGDKPAFYGLEDSLEELDIFASLKSASSLQLSHLRKLIDLDLSYNQLDALKADSFPTSLKYLIVSNNGIESFDDHVFAQLANLRTLWLDGNVLKTFKRSWLAVPLNKLVDLELDNNHLTSLPQDAFSGMPSLKTLSLRTNNIRRMERETWEAMFQQLHSISMEGNPLVCDSELKWIQQTGNGDILWGTCHEPADVAGEELHEWIRMA